MVIHDMTGLYRELAAGPVNLGEEAAARASRLHLELWEQKRSANAGKRGLSGEGKGRIQASRTYRRRGSRVHRAAVEKEKERRHPGSLGRGEDAQTTGHRMIRVGSSIQGAEV